MKTRLPPIDSPTSTLSVARPGIDLRIQVRSHFSKRLRRQVLLALFKAAKDVLCELHGRDVWHSDSGILSGYADLGRPVSLHQALGVTTSARIEGLNIRMRRLALGVTQVELSKATGLSRTHLSRIEHGHTTMEAMSREKIAFALKLASVKKRSAQMATTKGQVFIEGQGPKSGLLAGVRPG